MTSSAQALLFSRGSQRPSLITSLALSNPITINSFGLQVNKSALPTYVSNTAYGAMRQWDCTGSGGFMNWKNIETSKGVFDYSVPDVWVPTVAGAGKRIVWAIAAPGDWAVSEPAVGGAAYGGKSNMPPTNNADWTDFITAMVTRYPLIRYWQGWNEPNLALYYAGGTATSARLAELQRLLYQTVKGIDPSLTVLSPSFTSVFGGVPGLTSYLSASDGAAGTGKLWQDILAYHFYCNDASDRPTGLQRMWQGITGAMSAVSLNIPIWATETGLINPALTTYSNAQIATFVRIYMMTLLGLGVASVYWYSEDNTDIGLGAVGSAAYNQLASELIGKTIVGCEISVASQVAMTTSLRFGDGTFMSQSWSPMP